MQNKNTKKLTLTVPSEIYELIEKSANENNLSKTQLITNLVNSNYGQKQNKNDIEINNEDLKKNNE